MTQPHATLKTHIRELFDRSASTYDQLGPRFFSYFGNNLVKIADLKPGYSVLDVATGRGALLFPAAAVVGTTGSIVGIDLSPEMVKRSQLQVQQLSLKNITIQCMDGEDPKFLQNSFEYVLCGFSLFFFPELGKALSEFRRVLRPGGGVAVSIWGQGDTRWSWLGQLYEEFRQYLISDPNITPTHFHEELTLRTELRQAGFENIRTISDVAEFVYADADEWWNVQCSHVFRALIESIHPAKLNDFKREICQQLAAMQKSAGIRQRFVAIYALAKKSSV